MSSLNQYFFKIICSLLLVFIFLATAEVDFATITGYEDDGYLYFTYTFYGPLYYIVSLSAKFDNYTFIELTSVTVDGFEVSNCYFTELQEAYFLFQYEQNVYAGSSLVYTIKADFNDVNVAKLGTFVITDTSSGYIENTVSNPYFNGSSSTTSTSALATATGYMNEDVLYWEFTIPGPFDYFILIEEPTTNFTFTDLESAQVNDTTVTSSVYGYHLGDIFEVAFYSSVSEGEEFSCLVSSNPNGLNVVEINGFALIYVGEEVYAQSIGASVSVSYGNITSTESSYYESSSSESSWETSSFSSDSISQISLSVSSSESLAGSSSDSSSNESSHSSLTTSYIIFSSSSKDISFSSSISEDTTSFFSSLSAFSTSFTLSSTAETIIFSTPSSFSSVHESRTVQYTNSSSFSSFSSSIESPIDSFISSTDSLTSLIRSSIEPSTTSDSFTGVILSSSISSVSASYVISSSAISGIASSSITSDEISIKSSYSSTESVLSSKAISDLSISSSISESQSISVSTSANTLLSLSSSSTTTELSSSGSQSNSITESVTSISLSLSSTISMNYEDSSISVSAPSSAIPTLDINGAIEAGYPQWVVKVPGALGPWAKVELLMSKEGPIVFTNGAVSVDGVPAVADISVTSDTVDIIFEESIGEDSVLAISFGAVFTAPGTATALGILSITTNTERRLLKRAVRNYPISFSITSNDDTIILSLSSSSSASSSSSSSSSSSLSSISSSVSTSFIPSNSSLTATIITSSNAIVSTSTVTTTNASAATCNNGSCIFISTITGVTIVTTTEHEIIITYTAHGTLSSLSTATSKNISTVVITTTTCQDENCYPISITTGLITVSKTDLRGTTIYTTYCPLSEIESTTETTTTVTGTNIAPEKLTNPGVFSELSGTATTKLSSTEGTSTSKSITNYEDFGSKISAGSSLIVFIIGIMFL